MQRPLPWPWASNRFPSTLRSLQIQISLSPFAFIIRAGDTVPRRLLTIAARFYQQLCPLGQQCWWICCVAVFKDPRHSRILGRLQSGLMQLALFANSTHMIYLAANSIAATPHYLEVSNRVGWSRASLGPDRPNDWQKCREWWRLSSVAMV